MSSHIQFREYDTMPPFRHQYRPADWPSDEDYFEVFHTLDTDQWFAADVSAEGGSSRSAAKATQAEAVAEIEAKVLFHRRFWDKKVEWANNGDMTIPEAKGDKSSRVIRVNHQHYVIGAEPTADELRRNRQFGGLGHGGSEFQFRLLATGEVIVSRNVWSQGKIPKEYWEALPDNAEDVTPQLTFGRPPASVSTV